MNRRIVHLFGLVVLLFALLVAFTSRWTVFEAASLEDRTANRRKLLEEQRTPRGLILSREGERLADNRRRGRAEALRYVRRYPAGPLFAHAVGYSFVDRGQAGLERYYSDPLTGNRSELRTVVEQLTGRRREGDDLHTALDARAQRTAVRALAGRAGSVVAIEPATGRVRAMVSLPDFDPNLVPTRYSELNRAEGSPMFNRATQGRYAPGSTFKVVTAAAALDTGAFTPASIVDGGSPKVIGGVPLSNFGGQSFGPMTLTAALTSSVNTVWAQVGERLGGQTMFRYMKRFGFNSQPPIDYPKQQLARSGAFEGGKVLDGDDPVDAGRLAIGQERLQVSPLQMAMVAAAIANGGRLMRPWLMERIVARDGRVRDRGRPRSEDRVMRPETARALAGMMSRVVEEGSGVAAALSGIQVAGKTGTAEVAGGTQNQAWFIAFAPVDRPRMAIAVTVERAGAGTGGEVAAPIAKQVLEALL